MSGIAPQFTATNGLALRSLLPWMARANSSLPTDAGLALDQHRDGRGCRFLRRAQHAGHRLAAGDDVGEGQPALAAVADALQFALERRCVERVAQADLQPLEADRLDDEILGTGPHRRHHIFDAAMRGLHDDRDVQTSFTNFCEDSETVEARHHKVEHDGIDRLRLGCGQGRYRRVATVHDEGLIAALLHHVFNQTTLYGVIIGDQNGGSHGFPRTLRLSVSNRGTVADAD
ncbi:hypothetical protein ACVWY2_007736 [Bradyrhizobium sp. JR6.1]